MRLVVVDFLKSPREYCQNWAVGALGVHVECSLQKPGQKGPFVVGHYVSDGAPDFLGKVYRKLNRLAHLSSRKLLNIFFW